MWSGRDSGVAPSIEDPMDYETRTYQPDMDTYDRLDPADTAPAAVVEAISLCNLWILPPSF